MPVRATLTAAAADANNTKFIELTYFNISQIYGVKITHRVVGAQVWLRPSQLTQTVHGIRGNYLPPLNARLGTLTGIQTGTPGSGRVLQAVGVAELVHEPL